MKKTSVRAKRASDSDIDQFCRSVEEMLANIKNRRRRGRKKKEKEEDDFVSLKEDLLTFSQ